MDIEIIKKNMKIPISMSNSFPTCSHNFSTVSCECIDYLFVFEPWTCEQMCVTIFIFMWGVISRVVNWQTKINSGVFALVKKNIQISSVVMSLII